MEYGTLNWGALRLVAERAKIRLSGGDSQSVGGTVELSDSAGEVRAYEWSLTLAAVEDRVRHKFERLADMARAMVTSARERQLIDSLDVILMAGNAEPSSRLHERSYERLSRRRALPMSSRRG